MRTRRHHNNHALTSTKRGKRKLEVARMAAKLMPPCKCKHRYSDHHNGTHCFYHYNCECGSYTPKAGEFLCRRCGITIDGYLCPICDSDLRLPKVAPKRDVIIDRPEEEPGYGHGI